MLWGWNSNGDRKDPYRVRDRDRDRDRVSDRDRDRDRNRRRHHDRSRYDFHLHHTESVTKRMYDGLLVLKYGHVRLSTNSYTIALFIFESDMCL